MSAEVNVQALLDHTVMRLARGHEDRWNSLHLGTNTSPSMNMINGGSMVHQAKVHISRGFLTSQLIGNEMIPSCYLSHSSSKRSNEIEVVHHKLVLTMIDGKVCGALTQTSSQLCYICKAKPSEMNNLEKHLERVRDLPTLTYGLSSFMSGSNSSCPGSETTSAGNMARRFFLNSFESASITGNNVELIQRFATILRGIFSGLEINVEAFREYATETAKLYVNWYYMPPSVHKVLIHGRNVIKHAIVPIGLLSEEALEAQ
ncbi:hypothetical protein PR048_018610 [Dryococelus australis]|uniref:Uncharacterized protein n=1 Tax=Dryococelus australis TaxID=614101 RepID=A0ABQ9HCQ9_9NEOP|nr:hypothetical protein PR048_018610 [Dryococelus australis]